MPTRGVLTFTIRLQVSVHGRRLALVGHRPAGRGLRTGAETHVGGRGDLFSQGGELHGARGHGHIVCIVRRLGQSARVVMRRGVDAHGHVVLLDLFHRMGAHWHHSFALLRTREQTWLLKQKCVLTAASRLESKQLEVHQKDPATSDCKIRESTANSYRDLNSCVQNNSDPTRPTISITVFSSN